ncbi:MAG: response regulator [Gammaproteobacteria bacterium]|nr:response regulator [Gammaproteobacteria bacterium]
MSIDIDPSLMQELLETFRVQLDECIQTITENLLNLENDISESEQAQILDAVFRAAHNIKGASRGIGLKHTAKLSHCMEDIFTALKNGEITIQKELVKMCLLTLDTLSSLIDIEGQGDLPGEEYDKLLLQMEKAVAGDLPSSQQLADLQKPPSTTDEASTLENEPTEVSIDSIRLPTQRLNRIAALGDELQIVQLQIEQLQSEGRKILDLSGDIKRDWPKSMSDNLSQERRLFTKNTKQIQNLESICQNIDQNIRKTYSKVKFLSTNLQDNIHKLRLIPVVTILSPLKRVVWDLAESEKKKVELIIIGGHLEIDRLILEKIRDPLIHLLRNAVDHGIEPPDERIKAGKNMLGKITITITHEGDNVIFTILDDGAGIDLQSIRNKILDMELLSENELEQLSQQDIVEYIFSPGFSSRKNVSEISGRGVGLDVVRSNLQMLKGHATVSFTEQQGSAFLLTIPFTTASEYGVFVECSNQIFAIPAPNIKRVLEITSSDIINLESKQAISIDNKPIVLQKLNELLSLPDEKTDDDYSFYVIILHSGWHQLAVIVNHFINEQDIVIKSFKPPLDQQPNFLGGTIGNDGNVVLVLNIHALLSKDTEGIPITHVPKKESSIENKKILVVDDSITTRTLEVSILKSHGYSVQSVVCAEEAIEKLKSEHFDLLITDVEMPGMNGFELTHEVRTELEFSDLPIIIVTSLSKEEDKQKGLDVKADAYIVKSEFESKELLSTIAQLI